MSKELPDVIYVGTMFAHTPIGFWTLEPEEAFNQPRYSQRVIDAKDAELRSTKRYLNQIKHENRILQQACSEKTARIKELEDGIRRIACDCGPFLNVELYALLDKESDG